MALFIIRTNLFYSQDEWEPILHEIAAGGHQCYFDRSDYVANLPDDPQVHIDEAKVATGYESNNNIILVCPRSLFKNDLSYRRYGEKCETITEIQLPKISDAIRPKLVELAAAAERAAARAAEKAEKEARAREDALIRLSDYIVECEVDELDNFYRDPYEEKKKEKIEEKTKIVEKPKNQTGTIIKKTPPPPLLSPLVFTPYVAAVVKKPPVEAETDFYYEDKLLLPDRYNDPLLREAAVYRNKLFKSKSTTHERAFWNRFFAYYHRFENTCSLTECIQRAKGDIGQSAYEAAIRTRCCCFKSGTLKLIHKMDARSRNPDKSSLLRDDVEIEMKGPRGVRKSMATS